MSYPEPLYMDLQAQCNGWNFAGSVYLYVSSSQIFALKSASPKQPNGRVLNCQPTGPAHNQGQGAASGTGMDMFGITGMQYGGTAQNNGQQQVSLSINCIEGYTDSVAVWSWAWTWHGSC